MNIHSLSLNQVQQLELCGVNYAHSLFCRAQGKMGKIRSVAQSQEAVSPANGFSVGGSGSVKGQIVNLLLVDVWLLLQCGKLCQGVTLLSRAQGIRSVVQKTRDCFLPCQLVSIHHCLLLAAVRWKQ